jgi:hypothetical protein
MVLLIQCAQCGVGLIGFGMMIWWLITVYGALNTVSPRNREMEPGMVFLMLVPCFNIVWYFFIVLRLASSLEREFRDRGLSGDGDFGKTLGILTFFCFLCAPAAWICQFIYINKIRGYTTELASAGGGRGRIRDYEEDDDEDRPRRKRRRSRDDDDD